MNVQLLYLLQSASSVPANIFAGTLTSYAPAFGMSAGSSNGSMVPVNIVASSTTSYAPAFGMYAQKNDSSASSPMNFDGVQISFAPPFSMQPTTNAPGYTYRYIKFDQLNSDPGQLVGLVDIGLMTSYGMNWVTQSKATVTGSSQYDAGLQLAYLVDGNIGTRWVSAATGPQWVRIDLNSPRMFSQIVLTMYSAETARAPKSMTVLGSLDDVNYTEIGTFVGLTYPDIINNNYKSQTLNI